VSTAGGGSDGEERKTPGISKARWVKHLHEAKRNDLTGALGVEKCKAQEVFPMQGGGQGVEATSNPVNVG